jgi:hypothetical protein
LALTAASGQPRFNFKQEQHMAEDSQLTAAAESPEDRTIATHVSPGENEQPDLTAANRELLERLRDALLASAPDVDPGLVRGETLDEVEASFAAARASVERVREAVRKEFAELVPAGTRTRAPVRPATAFDKIREGLVRASR